MLPVGTGSRRVRCFRAAAWNTTSGCSSSKMRLRASRSRMSHRASVPSSRRALPVRLICVLWRADSSRSSRIILAGPNLAICRANSDPIEPPAPVTRTRLPVIDCEIEAASIVMRWRPRRSSRLSLTKVSTAWGSQQT